MRRLYFSFLQNGASMSRRPRGQCREVGERLNAGRLVTALLFLVLAPCAIAEPPDRPMTFRWHEDGGDGVIIAEGVIVLDTPAAFANFIGAHPSAEGGQVLLSSDGGDLEAALALGGMFRRYRMGTSVGELGLSAGGASGTIESRCASACVLAFVGGVARTLTPGSRLGVHQLRLDCIDRRRAQSRYPWLPIAGAPYCPQLDDGISASQSAQGAVTAYISAMGVDPMLVSLMSSTDPSGIRFLTEAELERFAVLTPEVAEPEENLP